MCFTHALLRDVPHRATSIVEDIEYGITLGLNGVRVVHVAEASVAGEMPDDGAAAASQRQRWEGGRRLLVRQRVPALVRRAFARRDAVALDLAADLVVPPLTSLALASALGTTAAVFASMHGISGAIAGLWIASLVALVVYVARGLQLSGLGLRGLGYLTWAPVFAIWKLALLLRPRRRGAPEWVRTARQGER
jgi:cellulose synthase/poly-beta-1,6-N-acetylglucosamine synthase-like glycosyltransferase